jgi:hypothetical protein
MGFKCPLAKLLNFASPLPFDSGERASGNFVNLSRDLDVS